MDGPIAERHVGEGIRAGVVHPWITTRTGSNGPGGADGQVTASPGGGPDADGRLAEAVSLAGAIGLEVVLADIVRLSKARPSTLLGAGRVDSLAETIADQAIEVVIVDGALSPVQQRNLERAWHCKVIDRTALILEIFGARARTREGRLQVELAALSYQRSRLVRSWTHLERQRGGHGVMGGPGETQIESDRRQIRERISRLERELAGVRRTRSMHREARHKVPVPVVALVGYTNAGKSTLFNALTGADVIARDQLFATLDPTMRGITMPSGLRVILSDTVGFVSDLPHALVAAFRATLEEVVSADLVLHVRDVSHADTLSQRADVVSVLEQLGLAERLDTGLVEVLNKLDLLPAAEREALLATRASDGAGGRRWVATSAVTGEGLDRLIAVIDEHFARTRTVLDIRVPSFDGATIAWLYRHGEVVSRRDEAETVRMRVALSEADAGRIRNRHGVLLDPESPPGATGLGEERDAG